MAATQKQELKKTQPNTFATFNSKEIQTMEKLNHTLMKPFCWYFHILVDKWHSKQTCNVQTAYISVQMQSDDAKNSIGYLPRLPTDTEQQFATTHREDLAIVWSVLLPRPYLGEQRFTVRTDHDALKWIQDLADVTWRLTRWSLRLMKFDFDVIHKLESCTSPQKNYCKSTPQAKTKDDCKMSYNSWPSTMQMQSFHTQLNTRATNASQQ